MILMHSIQVRCQLQTASTRRFAPDISFYVCSLISILKQFKQLEVELSKGIVDPLIAIAVELAKAYFGLGVDFCQKGSRDSHNGF